MRKLWSDFDHSFCFLTTYLTTFGKIEEKNNSKTAYISNKNRPEKACFYVF